MDLPKFNWKGVFKNTLIYGVTLEIMAIGTGYYLYREYKTNEEFRNNVEEKFPFMTEMYGAISGIYLRHMPKELKDKILDEKTEPSVVKSDVSSAQK